MSYWFVSGVLSPIIRVALKRSDQSINNNVGIATLTNASAGLSISIGADNATAPTVYSQAGGTIQSIGTIGTYAAPSANNCRFGPYDATNGIYELQFLNSVFNPGAGARRLILSINAVGSLNLAQCDLDIPLTVMDPYDPNSLIRVAMGQPSVPSVGSNPTVEQALTMLLQERLNYLYGAALKTVYKYDGVTPSYTITLSPSGAATGGIRAT